MLVISGNGRNSYYTLSSKKTRRDLRKSVFLRISTCHSTIVEPVSKVGCRVGIRKIGVFSCWTEFNLTTNSPAQTGVDFPLKSKPRRL